MDNHLCAGWCWIKQIDLKKTYNFLHIDRHYDLLEFKKAVVDQIIKKGLSIKEMSFKEYQDLRQFGEKGISWPLFRWDNHILNISYLYPALLHKPIFATHKEGQSNKNFVNYEPDVFELLFELTYWIDESNKPWIINLDIDYFFHQIDTDRDVDQIFSNKTIQEIAKRLKTVLNKVDVFTIALSPECCGGWEPSFRVLKILTDVLGLKFEAKLKNALTAI